MIALRPKPLTVDVTPSAELRGTLALFRVQADSLGMPTPNSTRFVFHSKVAAFQFAPVGSIHG